MAESKPKFYFHIGAPKTGTTYLQDLLWLNRETLRSGGLYVPGAGQLDHFHLERDLRRQHQRANHPESRWDGTFDRLVGEVEAEGAAASVVSAERLCAATPEQIAAAMARLSDFEVHVVYGVRDMVSLLASEWQESVKHSNQRSFPEWLADVREHDEAEWFWKANALPEVVDRWAPGDPSRLHVVTFPRAGSAPVEVWARFALAVGWTGPIDTGIPPRNHSLGLVEATLLQRIQSEMPDHVPNPHKLALVREEIADGVLSDRPTSVPILVPEQHRAWVTEQTARRVRFLDESDVDVVGDLGDLVDDEAGFGSSSPDGQAGLMLDAASDVGGVLVGLLVGERARADQLDRRLAEAGGTGAHSEVSARGSGTARVRAAASRRLRRGAPGRRRAFLHIGAPKTGTTYLQAVLWANAARLREEGIFLPGNHQVDHFRIGAEIRKRSDRHHLDARTDLTDAALNSFDASGCHTMVITDERLAKTSPEMIARLLDRLGHLEVHVIYGMRDFAGLLTSSWQERVKNGGSEQFEPWLDSISEHRADDVFWLERDAVRVVERWRTDDPQRVHLLTLPGRGSPETELWDRFRRIIGFTGTSTTDVQKANESLGFAEASFLALLQDRVDAAVPRQRRTGAVKRLANGRLALRPDPIPILISDRHRGWIAEETERQLDFYANSGFDLVGDADELRDSNRRFGRVSFDEHVPEILDVAVDVDAFLVAQIARERSRNDRARQQLEHVAEGARRNGLRRLAGRIRPRA